MPALSAAEQMLYSTVKLTSLRGGGISGTGTGFFFRFATKGDEYVPAIITNNHVIDGNDAIVAICHIADAGKPSGKYITCRVDVNAHTVIRHPDPNVDLCAIFFGSTISQTNSAGTPIFFIGLDPSLIPTDDDWQYFDAIEEVTMIGCPNGISDEVNNLPITRKGITASSLAKDYNGAKEFMVDMACFPGSSGSPVFVYDRSGYLDRKTNNYLVGAVRVKLVGVLYAGPQVTNAGAIILAQPPKIQVASMMHLGNVIKSSAIMDIDKVIRLQVGA